MSLDAAATIGKMLRVNLWHPKCVFEAGTFSSTVLIQLFDLSLSIQGIQCQGNVFSHSKNYVLLTSYRDFTVIVFMVYINIIDKLLLVHNVLMY